MEVKEQICFGVDVGGTSVKLGLFDTAGSVLEKWEIATRTVNNGICILPDIAETILGKLKAKDISKARCLGVGLGVPGPVSRAGVVPTAVNLGWGRTDVKGELAGLTGLRTEAVNDANAAALGEMWKGGARGSRDVILVTLGTGVGGGILVNGQVVCGQNGAGGEIGHIHLEDHEDSPCNCGNKGCLEQYASATGIVRLAKQALRQDQTPSLLREEELTAKAVFDAVKEGDKLAGQVAEQFGGYLGRALAQIACVCDPEVFVIGGGVSKAGPILLDYIRKYYLRYAFKSCRDAKFALAQLGNDAGIYGAASLVLSQP